MVASEPQGRVKPFEDLPTPENFDVLFDNWASEALQVAKFPASKPQPGNRIPDIVKRKVAQMCEMKICFPDSRPACFRMADSKKGKGGPYNWFSYFGSIKTILPNWEYLVQIAAFRDLIVEYGYSPDWMKFEYHESMPPVWLAVDIGIRTLNGPKIFVEVKETKSQWKSLIMGIEIIGSRGVNLSSPDRGNDPSRKAKYIVAGHPDYFVGNFPEGFDSYKVVYESEGRFRLHPTTLPKASSFQGVSE